MNYSHILYIAIIGIFVANVPAHGAERRTAPLTFEERRQRSRIPLTTEQTEQGRIKATSATISSKDMEQLNTPQKTKKKKSFFK